MTNSETQVASFFAKYDPTITKLGKALRAKLRARLPGMFEIVYFYETQSALVISYSPTDQGYGGVCSLALYPSGVKLHFGRGAELSKSDPKKLLKGSGKTVRHVELNSMADFNRAEVEVLIAAALKLAQVKLEPGAKGSVILKAESQKQRASRSTKTAAKPATKTAGKAARTASPRRKTKARAG